MAIRKDTKPPLGKTKRKKHKIQFHAPKPDSYQFSELDFYQKGRLQLNQPISPVINIYTLDI